MRSHVHLAAAQHQLLADLRHVVLDRARDDAGAAAGAAVEIDRHAPAVGAVGRRVVDRVVGPPDLVLAVRLAVRGALALRERRERHGLGQLAPALVVGVLHLRDARVCAGRGHRRARREPRAPAGLVGERRQQRDHVHAARLARATLVRVRSEEPHAVALADRDRDHVVANAAARQHRQLDACRTRSRPRARRRARRPAPSRSRG